MCVEGITYVCTDLGALSAEKIFKCYYEVEGILLPNSIIMQLGCAEIGILFSRE